MNIAGLFVSKETFSLQQPLYPSYKLPGRGTPMYILVVLMAYQILEVGAMDMVELFINKEVFIVHNFPELLGMQYDDTKQFNWLWAGLSGIKAAMLPLVLATGVKLLIAYFGNIKKSTSMIYHAALAAIMTVLDTAVLATYDRNKALVQQTAVMGYRGRFFEAGPGVIVNNYIFRNHNWFYRIHIGIEVASIVFLLFMTYKGRKTQHS